MNQINSLIAHGAAIKPEDGTLYPLTVEFYHRAVDTCLRSGCNAITYALHHPGIDEELGLAIWADGHVDCGSMESIQACLDR